MQTGKLSINSDNIFPIIKKWLYNEKDIYARELISNGSDAITKLKKLKDLGDYVPKDENEKYQIDIIIDKDAKTIKFIDNGLGMTDEEIDKYINQIAFSGAKEFMESHQSDSEDNSIIGHFGLGFYSAFMVSESVKVESKAYGTNEANSWFSKGETLVK